MCWKNQLLKMQAFAALCAFLTSLLFCFNNLLIQNYKLHCTDLLIVRSGVQVVLFGGLLKTRQSSITSHQQWAKNEYVLMTLQVCIFLSKPKVPACNLILLWFGRKLYKIGKQFLGHLEYLEILSKRHFSKSSVPSMKW